ncbi:phosphatase PAP2 family protein [Anaerotruncus colihominis]|uniref:phosphatase PAP2 family protein n=1 Tax=Anaerotruncus colihominis TaxID=169435 RepID=UPI0026F148E7|nr:phosphatase PAP2 family protein [Anaerotruncus colihominis]
MDLTIVNWIATHLRCPPLDFLMPAVTMLGEYGFIWIAVCIVLLARKQTRRMGYACALSLLIAFLCGEIVLKNIVQRARPFTHLPDLTLLIPPPGSFSFPSGHTGSSFAAACSLTLSNRRNGWWAIPLAILIAFSRLYLCVHYPTDTLAGALLGLLSALAARRLLRGGAQT